MSASVRESDGAPLMATRRCLARSTPPVSHAKAEICDHRGERSDRLGALAELSRRHRRRCAAADASTDWPAEWVVVDGSRTNQQRLGVGRGVGPDSIVLSGAARHRRDHELPWAREYGCAIVAYTPLGQPVLDASVKKYRVLAEIGRAHGVTAHAVALAFLIRDPSVFAIPKASNIEHVEANAKAGDLKLSREEIDVIDAAFPKRKRVGPLPTN